MAPKWGSKIPSSLHPGYIRQVYTRQVYIQVYIRQVYIRQVYIQICNARSWLHRCVVAAVLGQTVAVIALWRRRCYLERPDMSVAAL